MSESTVKQDASLQSQRNQDKTYPAPAKQAGNVAFIIQLERIHFLHVHVLSIIPQQSKN